MNEQNPQAQGFYEHCGWHVIGRPETDEQGEPYPILHMELPPTPAELAEAKRQIESTLHKLRATLNSLEAKNEPGRRSPSPNAAFAPSVSRTASSK